MASVDSTQRKRNNYKILVDPELKQGHKKVYRLNGKDVTGFPPVGEPKDPRTQKTVLGVTGSTVDLKVPRFKYDKFWNGEPPDRDVFVIGLNESVKGSLLKEVCTEIASVHSIKFHRHPKTKTFLGAATVSFMRSGEGRRAAGELDGRIVGGCYLRAELDDRGEHLQKYLEPVLKKCGLDKKPKSGIDGSECKDSGVASSDVEESRTRHSSIAESGQELSESETEQQPGATPITPTRRKSSDSFLAPSKSTKLYPFSSLMLSSCTPSTFSESSPTPTIFSPGLTNYTPSSIDSGISLRTNTILSPQEAMKTKLPRTFQSPLPPPSSNTPPPPLPPEEKAPPLPPQDQEAPPPLPPLPPAPKQDSSGQDGIENISSEEEEEGGNRGVGTKKGEAFESKMQSEVDTISPISLSPPNSPKTTSSTNMNVQPAHFPSQVNSHFDPSLGLQTLLASRNATSSGTPMEVSTSPYAAVSPGPTTTTAANASSYELEVEEISGDESPVMVYDASFEPLKVESVSDDDVDMGGDDMEVCSDDENAQDTVIEVNVRPVVQQQAFPPMMGGVPPHIPPPPPPHLPQLPPHSFFPHRLPPPGTPFPPPLPHPPPPHGPDFVPPHPPLPPPHTHHPSDMNPPLPDMLPSQFDTPPAPYVKDFPSPRLPNGYMNYSNSSRFTSNRNKSDRTLHLPKSKKESISQDVLCKALNQLRAILLNDVQKKLVESYAYSALDSFWEKREKEKLTQKSSTEQTSEGGEKVPKPVVEPYRRMLPGLKIGTDGATGVSEEEEGEPNLPTPRKRLMNFKIPLINRGAQRRDQSLSSVVARRRLFSDEEDAPSESVAPSRGSHSYYSDISSEELSSHSESEEFSGEEESEMESAFEETENSEEDADKEYRDIFGSSEDSAGEERETKVKLPSRRTSTRSDISGDEEQRAMKQKQAKQSGNRTSSNDEEGILRTSALGSEVLKETEHLVMEDKEKLSQIQLDKIMKPKPAPPRPQFKKRLVSGDEEILQRVVERGPDKEDVQMFRLALGRMKSDGNEMVAGVSWAYYPHISLSAPPPKRRRLMLGRRGWEEEEGEHMTGCARSEGYYKIDMRKKKKYLPHHRMMKHPTTSVPGKKPQTTSSGRVNRANQRRLASVFSSGDISSDLAKYNQLKARKKQLRFAKSTIHNWGLFAMENIAADEMVIEYVGEMVRQAVADERERRYEAAGIGSSYLFRVDHDYIIDATRNGNLARFINHCCDPNCYAKVISFGTQKKIVIYSKRDIALGEEITYDYKFPIEEDKIPCLCGAPNCRGTLN